MNDDLIPMTYRLLTLICAPVDYMETHTQPKLAKLGVPMPKAYSKLTPKGEGVGATGYRGLAEDVARARDRPVI